MINNDLCKVGGVATALSHKNIKIDVTALLRNSITLEHSLCGFF